jgi:hypothetical protein
MVGNVLPILSAKKRAHITPGCIKASFNCVLGGLTALSPVILVS